MINGNCQVSHFFVNPCHRLINSSFQDASRVELCVCKFRPLRCYYFSIANKSDDLRQMQCESFVLVLMSETWLTHTTPAPLLSFNSFYNLFRCGGTDDKTPGGVAVMANKFILYGAVSQIAFHFYCELLCVDLYPGSASHFRFILAYNPQGLVSFTVFNFSSKFSSGFPWNGIRCWLKIFIFDSLPFPS